MSDYAADGRAGSGSQKSAVADCMADSGAGGRADCCAAHRAATRYRERGGCGNNYQ
jgi:hypothetical protein